MASSNNENPDKKKYLASQILKYTQNNARISVTSLTAKHVTSTKASMYYVRLKCTNVIIRVSCNLMMRVHWKMQTCQADELRHLTDTALYHQK